MTMYCPECKQHVPTYIPKDKDHLHYKRHYVDLDAPKGSRDRCFRGGEPVSLTVIQESMIDGMAAEECPVTEPTDEELLERVNQVKEEYPDIDPEALSRAVGASIERIGEVLQSTVSAIQGQLSELAARFSPPPMNRAQRRVMKRGGRVANHAVRVRR